MRSDTMVLKRDWDALLLIANGDWGRASGATTLGGDDETRAELFEEHRARTVD